MGIELPPRLGSPEMAERPITIRPMDADDWASVRSIYEEGIATGDATFETAAPVWEAWDAGHLKSCRFVAIDQGVTVGWAALSGVSVRLHGSGRGEHLRGGGSSRARDWPEAAG